MRRRRRAVALLVVTGAAAIVVAMVASGGSGTTRGAPSDRGIAKSHGTSRPSSMTPAGSGSPGSAAAGVPIDPSRFATGACMAFAPTDGNRHRTVFIDAGHGGVDPGAVGVTKSGQTVHEADETLPVELETMALLQADGYRVVVSRTRSSTVIRPRSQDLTGGVLTPQGVHDDIASRDICANMAHATVLLGIYFDAGASPSDAGCITTYDAARSFASQSLRLATLVQRDVLERLNSHGWQIPNDGVVTDSGLGGPPLTATAGVYGHLLLLGPADPGWFSTPSRMPGALIEPLFVTDPFEATIAASHAGHAAIAHGLAHAVEQYFGSAAGSGSPSTG